MYCILRFTKDGCEIMQISFIGVLTKPLKLKFILILTFNLFLLFLPAILSANFLGIESIIFKIALGLAFIIANGYLWTFFQHEVEEDDNDFPKWNFINNFFIGLKGLIFSLASMILLVAVLFVLWLLIQHVPDSQNIAFIIAILWSIYWLLMFNTVTMGMFSENFNPVEALKFATIAEITTGCWLNYLVASFYMIGYILILGIIGFACIIFFGQAYINFVYGFVIIYAIIVYFSLYAKVFRQIRTEFESHF